MGKEVREETHSAQESAAFGTRYPRIKVMGEGPRGGSRGRRQGSGPVWAPPARPSARPPAHSLGSPRRGALQAAGRRSLAQPPRRLEAEGHGVLLRRGGLRGRRGPSSCDSFRGSWRSRSAAAATARGWRARGWHPSRGGWRPARDVAGGRVLSFWPLSSDDAQPQEPPAPSRAPARSEQSQ